MKILFVQKMNGISGSELYLMQIMPELVRRGYQVEMLLVFPTANNNNQRFIEHLDANNIPAHEIYGHGAISPILFYKIRKLLKNGNYDIIQTNLIHADFWMATMKLFFNRKLKIISVNHGYNPAYQAKYGNDLRFLKYDLTYWILKYSCRQINFNVPISKGLYDVFVNGGITKKSKIKTINYGLTLEPRNEAVAGANANNDQFLLITGRLISVKGHAYLIEAWKTINQHYPELKLYIAGDGEIRAQLEALVAEANLVNSIVFLGYVANPHPLMERCLFTLVTSRWEGFGLILLESWLHKKTIVSFNGPAMNEVIDDGKNGLLVKMNDSEDLAEKIMFLLKNPEKAKEYGENGYQKLNSFYTLKRMTDEMEEVYKAINDNYSPL
jgi:glycosyltransferase involved in cell wall biosynthesis